MDTKTAGKRRWWQQLYVQVLIAIAIGILLGHFAPDLGAKMKPFGDGFIKLVKMIIAPVVFLTVVVGIAKMGDLRHVGRIGVKALVYFEVVTTIALAIGLGLLDGCPLPRNGTERKIADQRLGPSVATTALGLVALANIVGTYHLYEAARKQGVRRIVFASSNHVTGFYRQDEVIDARMPVRPDGHYGLSKAYGENLAQFYWDRHGIETVSLRIGSSFPAPKDRRMLATWLSYDDLERLVVASLTAPVVRHTVVYGMSDKIGRAHV